MVYVTDLAHGKGKVYWYPKGGKTAILLDTKHFTSEIRGFFSPIFC